MCSGDWGNLFILANSGLFLASVILQNAGVVDWHSASFVDVHFCSGKKRAGDFICRIELAERNARAEATGVYVVNT